MFKLYEKKVQLRQIKITLTVKKKKKEAEGKRPGHFYQVFTTKNPATRCQYISTF